MGELIFLGIVAAICGVFFYLSFDFQVSLLDRSGGAAMWPRIIIAFLLIFVIIRFIQVLREKKKGEFVFLELFRGPRFFLLASLVVYIIAFKYVGYIISTTVFLLVVVNVFYKWTKDNFGSVKSIVIRNVLLILFVIMLYYFFAEVVHILLPTGTLWSALGM